MAHDVVKHAVELGRTKVLSKCTSAKWEAEERWFPVVMAEKGWEQAWPIWFNAVLGWGHVLCEDGKRCFVHFKSVIDENGRTLASKGEFPILEPQRTVAIKWQDSDKGRRATAVRFF